MPSLQVSVLILLTILFQGITPCHGNFRCRGSHGIAFAPLTRISQRQCSSSEHRLDSIQISPTDEDQISYAEQSRRFRRTYFTHADWRKHRSGDRLLRNLRSTLNSGVVRQLSDDLARVAAVAFAICFWNDLFVRGYQDFSGQLHPPLLTNLPLICLPIEPFSLSSPALGLLLVFRTNASFARWAEARQAWGAVVNNSRNLLRLGASWIPQEESEGSKSHLKELADATWAFARCLQRHLLGMEEDEIEFCNDIQSFMTKDTAQSLIAAQSKPIRAMYDLTNVVNALPLPYLRRLEFDKSIVRLCDALGVCDRIFSSPVPLVYTRHTTRFLGFWTLALPLGLWDAFNSSWNHVEVIPASLLISFFLYGIEELATQLEEPFSILPMDVFVQGIRMASEDMIEWHCDAGSTKSHHSIPQDETLDLLLETLLDPSDTQHS